MTQLRLNDHLQGRVVVGGLRGLAVAIVCSCLVACIGNWGFVYDQKIVGPYHLVAVDEMEQMAVCVRGDRECDVVEHGDATVFAAGGDDRYVVFVRHPQRYGSVNTGPDEYYYVIRQSEERLARVVGPFDEPGFQTETERLGLPTFSIVLEQLR